MTFPRPFAISSSYALSFLPFVSAFNFLFVLFLSAFLSHFSDCLPFSPLFIYYFLFSSVVLLPYFSSSSFLISLHPLCCAFSSSMSSLIFFFYLSLLLFLSYATAASLSSLLHRSPIWRRLPILHLFVGRLSIVVVVSIAR